ncbi:MAG: MOSC domain-containing protein [Armatimonadetes bacterium]|nr:MOSC domain-containing protein [Armatimonadota bacterium]
MPTILSVNTGRVLPFDPTGKARPSGIVKLPREGRVTLGALGLDGDEHAADVHGGEFQAVYAYSKEDYAWWAAELGRDLEPGLFGENLTVEGINMASVRSGDLWRLPNAVLEATQPRLPCATFQARMKEEEWVKRFDAGQRWGVYFRVVAEGSIGQGETVFVESAPSSSPTIYDMARIRTGETHRAAELLSAPALSPKWRNWAESASAS